MDDEEIPAVDNTGYLDARYRGWTILDDVIFRSVFDRNIQRILHLDVSFNNLECLPDEIGTLDSLMILNCSKNRLLTIPRTIGNLKTLITLKANGNRLFQLVDEIGDCVKLQTLQLSENYFERIPDTLSRCMYLTTMHLQNNRLVELPICLSRLRDFELLKDMDVSHNPSLTMIPQSMCRNTKVILWILSIHYDHWIELESIERNIQEYHNLIQYQEGCLVHLRQTLSDLQEKKFDLLQERKSVAWFLRTYKVTKRWYDMFTNFMSSVRRLFAFRTSRIDPLQ